MYITAEELNQYRKNGYLLRPDYFSYIEIDVLKSQLNEVFLENSPRRVMESNGLIRSAYGAHADNGVFRKLVRHPKLLKVAKQIIESDVYVHQFKVNAKAAMGGDIWKWHQDFIFWNKEDGLSEPRIVNMAIFLDEVTEFNGPLMLVPGSHHTGMIDIKAQPTTDEAGGPQWITNLTADLKYSLDQNILRDIVCQNGIVAPKGPSGSLLLFDPNIIHGSAANISPFDRAVIIVTYNSVANLPSSIKRPPAGFSGISGLPCIRAIS
jgi:hypothetical protein